VKMTSADFRQALHVLSEDRFSDAWAA